MSSKWANTKQDTEAEARLKQEKQEKKRLKAEKQLQEQQRQQLINKDENTSLSEPPSKRRRISTSQEGLSDANDESNAPTPLLRLHGQGWAACRNISEFETLNAIEEGTYGHVSRARNRSTDEIVALKDLKIDPSNTTEGFPVTALREIQNLRLCSHRNVIKLQEVITSSEQTSTKNGRWSKIYLVLEYACHDLRSLLDEMIDPFKPSEIKTLMLQLSSGLEYLHDHWIVHRDLKTSNILLNDSATVKLADFGMSRVTSDPPPENLTKLVVTLWYRAPELLLGVDKYGFEVDVWSLGCVFAELLCNEAILQGRNEVDQLSKVFDLCGIPDDKSWPGFRALPNARVMKIPLKSDDRRGNLKQRFSSNLSDAGLGLLKDMLRLNPSKRPTASEVLMDDYFVEAPRPKAEELFPTFPSKAGLEKKRRKMTPPAPLRISLTDDTQSINIDQ